MHKRKSGNSSNIGDKKKPTNKKTKKSDESTNTEESKEEKKFPPKDKNYKGDNDSGDEADDSSSDSESNSNHDSDSENESKSDVKKSESKTDDKKLEDDDESTTDNEESENKENNSATDDEKSEKNNDSDNSDESSDEAKSNSGDESEESNNDESKRSKAPIPELPTAKEDRIPMQEYMYKDEVRFWDGKSLKCRHRKKKDACKKCNPKEFPCKKCKITCSSKRGYKRHLKSKTHLLGKNEVKKLKKKQGLEAHITGAESEIYMTNLVKTHPEINYCQRIGQTGNTFDHIIKFNYESFYRGFQTKTLSEDSRNPGSFSFNFRDRYEKNTIICGPNKSRTAFFCLPYSLIKGKSGAYLSPSGDLSKYLFDDETKFKAKLFEELKSTTIIEGDISYYLTDDQRQEYLSMLRLEEDCKKRGIPFRLNDFINEVDAFINEKTIQHKSSSSTPTLNKYTFNITQGSKPYSFNGKIQYFIFNPADEKYKNDFYIIPEKIMDDRGLLSKDGYEGKTGIHIATRDYKNYDWTKEFRNNFALLYQTTFDKFLGKDPLQKRCIMEKLEYKPPVNRKVKASIGSINTKKIKYLYTDNAQQTVDDYYNYSGFFVTDKETGYRPYHENDDYEFYIIHMEQFLSDFLILPKTKLIQKGIIATKTQTGTSWLRFSLPGKTTGHWSEKYWNKFELFR